MRKFFINRLKGVIRPDAVEQLVGHEGYLDISYRKIPEDELKKLYLEGVSALNVFERSPDLSGVNEELHEKDRQISDLQQEMQKIRMELLEVKMKQVQELQRKEKE